MKTFFFVFFVFFIFSSCLNKKYDEYKIIEGKRIGNLFLGRKLNPNSLKDSITYQIDSDSIIIELGVNSSRYITSKGVKIGDDISKVHKLYGKKNELNLNKGNINIGSVSNIIIYKKIIFIFDKNKVEKILIKKNNTKKPL